MHNNADQGRKQMTNDQLIKESERIGRDEYSVWAEFRDDKTGLVWTVEQLTGDLSESDNPLQLLEGIVKGFDLWKDEKKDRASSHDPSVGFDASDDIRFVREHNL
jgi:hypothetical protein